MPIHDWTRVDAGLFHAFHHRWIDALCDALNEGGLPPDYFALPEQSFRGPIPNVLTLRLSSESDRPIGGPTALTVAADPPRARVVRRLEQRVYARKADRVTIRHRHGHIVAVEAGSECVAYVEFVAVGDVLPDIPLFLTSGLDVVAPLEATYQTTWRVFPAALKGLLENPRASTPEEN